MTAETVEKLLLWVYREGGGLLLMERAETNHPVAPRLECSITGDQLHKVYLFT